MPKPIHIVGEGPGTVALCGVGIPDSYLMLTADEQPVPGKKFWNYFLFRPNNPITVERICPKCQALRGNSAERKEAEIVINGVKLTHAQSMSVRAAVSSMLMDLAEPELVRALGMIGPLYKAKLGEVMTMIIKGTI